MSTRDDRLVLAVGASGDAGAVFAALSDAYTVHAEPSTTMRWTWLDTADWRLHRDGIALREERHGKDRELVAEQPGGVVSAPLTGARWPARLSTLPESEVRDALAPVVGVRALLPVADVENRRILLRLMDEVGKTRVRVSVDQQRLLAPRKAALPLHITVRPLRGYDRDARRCADLLAAAMGAEPTSLSPTDAALQAAGRHPGAEGAQLEIAATDPAVRPLAKALLGYVAVVDDARDGALADLDTEFLHDLRSAIRSTRALLSVAGQLLPGRSAVRVERDLSWLYEQTATLRAIDIALLDLSQAAGPDLDPIRDALRRRRRTELRRMRSALRAPRAPAAFTAWRRDLAALLDADVIGPSAAEAAASLPAAAFESLAATDPAAEDYVLRLDALREVLAAYAPLHTDAGDSLTAALDDAHEQLRRRDRARLTSEQLRATAHTRTRPGTDLPVDALLAAGAALAAAGRAADEAAAAAGTAHAAVVAKRNRRRVQGLVS